MPDNDWMRFIIFVLAIFALLGIISKTFDFIENIKKAKETIDWAQMKRYSIKDAENTAALFRQKTKDDRAARTAEEGLDDNEERPEGG